MSKPVDLKTVKIFEPLKKKPSFENKIFNTLNSDLVYEALSNNSNETVTLWFKLQQSSCNNAYITFRDYDSYLILVYLVNQVFQKYSDRFQYLSFQEFYEKNELNIDKINLIEISKELNIPKETIRRKVNFLQDQNIIFRKGKTIFFNNAINRVQKPYNSKKMLVNFLEKTSSILGKEEWFGKSFSKEEGPIKRRKTSNAEKAFEKKDSKPPKKARPNETTAERRKRKPKWSAAKKKAAKIKKSKEAKENRSGRSKRRK